MLGASMMPVTVHLSLKCQHKKYSCYIYQMLLKRKREGKRLCHVVSYFKYVSNITVFVRILDIDF